MGDDADKVVFIALADGVVLLGSVNPEGGIAVHPWEGEADPHGEVSPQVIVIFDTPHDPEVIKAALRDPPAPSSWSGIGFDLVPITRQRIGVAPLRWKDHRVHLDLRVRCLVGSGELAEDRSDAALLRFAGELKVAGATISLNRAAIGERTYKSVNISEVKESHGLMRAAGPPSPVLAQWGVDSLKWEGEVINVHFRAPPAWSDNNFNSSNLRSVCFERLVRRLGPASKLGYFGLRAECGDWLKFEQRPQFDWATESLLPRLRHSQTSAPLMWAVEMTYSEAPNPPACLTVNVMHARVLQAWNSLVGGHITGALESQVPGAKVSFLPELMPEAASYSSNPFWAAITMVKDCRPASPSLLPSQLKVSHPTLQPLSGDGDASGSMDVLAAFPGVSLHEFGENLQCVGKIVPRRVNPKEEAQGARRSKQMEVQDQGHFRFDLILSGPRETAATSMFRLGALDMAVGVMEGEKVDAQVAGDESRSWMRSQFDAAFGESERSAVAFSSLLVLPLCHVTAGAQDPEPRASSAGRDYETPIFDEKGYAAEEAIRSRFKRVDAIVIPLKRRPQTKDADTKAQFVLRARDNFDRREERDRTLSLNLMRIPDEQIKGADKRLNVIVLDRQPLLIAQVNTLGLGGVEGPESDLLEIGNWSSDAIEAPAWQLRGSPDGFDLMLPCQTIGEAMERGKDLPDAPIRGKIPGIDWRLSPPARFSLLSSYNPQRFPEAAWNLRRVLGYPGQRAPGAGTLRMDFELLYGLMCEVKTPLFPPPIRLAELSSRTGAPPRGLPREPVWSAAREEHPLVEAYRKYRTRWSQLYSAYLSRLGVLQPYSDYQPQGLLLESDVTFRLRRSADLAYPFPAAKRPADSQVPVHEEGLKGGLSWGFESAAVYEELWKNPASTAAKLVSPAFSTLGGWGYQKASFSQNKTIIHSNTSMGRVFYYSLERIGRIACLWNNAKHVIIYERTVVPSQQFMPDIAACIPPKYQNALLGRAVLRKVAEFVEVTEPIRRFPESGADPKTCGCIRGAHFKTTIMAVNSARLVDLTDGTGSYIGYTIPLWHPDDELENPEVYPRPHIDIRCACADGSNEDVGCECEDPSQLYFFSSTRTNDAGEPSRWLAVAGVDYADVPPCHAPEIPAFDQSAEEGDLADAHDVEPGYERFTLKLRPPDRLVNLAAERVNAAGAAVTLGAKLTNVTFMRAKAAGTAALTGAFKDVIAPAQAAAKALNGASDFVQSVLDRAESLRTNVNREADRLREEIGEGFDFNQHIRSKQAEIEAQVKQFAIEQEKRIPADVKKGFTEAFNHAKFAEKFLNPGAICEAIKKQVSTARQTFYNRCRASLESYFDALAALVSSISRELASQPAPASNAAERAADAVRQLAERLHAEIILVFKSGAALVKLLTELRDELLQPIAAFQREIERFERDVRALASFVPINQRIDQFQDELDNLWAKADFAGRVLEALKRRFKLSSPRIELTTPPPEIKRAIANARTSLSGQFDPQKVEAFFTAFKDALKEYAVFYIEGTQPLIDALSSAIAALNDFAKSMSGHIEAAIPAMVEAIKREVGTIAGDAERRLLQVVRDAQGVAIDAFEKSFGLVSAPIVKFEDDACATIEQLVNRLLKQLQKLGDSVTSGLADAVADAIGGERLRALRDKIQNIDATVRDHVASVVQGAQTVANEVADSMHHAGDQVLRTLRSVGHAPIVDGLDFNRKKVGYLLDEARKAVGTTPLAAMPARVAGAVKELLPQRLRVPAREMLDKVLPDQLKDFDLAKLVPSFAGLELGKMLPGLKMPEAARDNVKVTHGFDRQAMRAWVKADTLFKVEAEQTLFNVMGLKISVKAAQFQSTADISADKSGAVRRTIRGNVRADWVVTMGGYTIVTFRQTTLEYQDGKLDFNISANKVILAEVLKFLSDLMQSIGYRNNGLTLALIQSGQIPVGIRAALSLPLPDMGGGTTAVVNLVLRAGFELRALNDSLQPDFSLAVFLALSSKEAPFAITFFILGGSGYIEIGARYAPGRGSYAVYVHLSLYACAMLAIAIGPIRGSVFIGIGIGADLELESGRQAALSVGAELLIRGAVDVCGIITAGITLLLTIRYELKGGHSRIVGRGTLSIRIKICWCFTLSVSVGVEFGFDTSSGGSNQVAMAPQRRLGWFDPVLALAGVVATEPVTPTINPYKTRTLEYLEMFDS